MANITGKARIAGVMGWPVTHSLSPKFHNYWLQLYGIDGAYIPLSVHPDYIGEVITALPKMGLSGVNLTLPHKELVLPYLDSMDDAARAIGAVNTIVIENAKLHGMNTDAYGFSENIRPHLPAKKRKAVVLGAGGAAKAVAYALVGLGFQAICVLNRTPDRADALAIQLGKPVSSRAWSELPEALQDCDLLVNCTSLGMHGKEALLIDLSPLPIQALVTDIVYVPLETALLHQAKARGNPTVDGLGMLIHQAVPGFEAWFGKKPDVTADVLKYICSGG